MQVGAAFVVMRMMLLHVKTLGIQFQIEPTAICLLYCMCCIFLNGLVFYFVSTVKKITVFDILRVGPPTLSLAVRSQFI